MIKGRLIDGPAPEIGECLHRRGGGLEEREKGRKSVGRRREGGGLSFAYINLHFNYVCTVDVILICMIVYNMKKQ